jgi:hypothetical protein
MSLGTRQHPKRPLAVLEGRGREFTLEVSWGSEPFNAVFGPSLQGHTALESEEARELVEALKRMASIEASSRPTPQIGSVQLGNDIYAVNYCPQVDGEMFVFHWVKRVSLQRRPPKPEEGSAGR